jgi:hypothetical protein
LAKVVRLRRLWRCEHHQLWQLWARTSCLQVLAACLISLL